MISVVAVGALAGGVAIASTSSLWTREASQPDVGHGGASRAPGEGPAVPSAPVPAAPVQPVAVPTTPTPPVSTELPALSRAPAPALWRADGPGAFLRTSWNTVGAAPPRVSNEEVSVALTGRGQRSELEPALPAVREGDQHDLTFSVRLDGDFAAGSTARQVIARWENDSPGQAPLELRVHDGDLVLHGGEGHPSGPRTFTCDLGAAPLGQWTQLRIVVRFSADPDKAAVSVWRDGRSLVDGDHPRGGTLYPGQQSYLKVGLHRDRTIAATSTVRFGAWHVAHGRAGADPVERRPSDRADRDRGSASDEPARERDRRSTPPDTSPRHRSDTPHRSRSEASTPDGSDSDGDRHPRTTHHDTSPGSTSHRREADDDSTSGRHAEQSPRTAHHDASPRSTSADSGTHRESSDDGGSAHSDGGRAHDSGSRSDEGSHAERRGR